jgi:hypothetical protein
MQAIGRRQAMRYRLHVNHLTRRLPPGSCVVAAHCGVQDSGPRSGLISLAARVSACSGDAWCDSRLVQTYCPRAAVHLLPAADLAVFTIGRLPSDPAARQAIEDDADRICRVLDGRVGRTQDLPPRLGDRLRAATASGRLLVRWDARSVRIRECARQALEPADAAIELARRHLHHYGPTTSELFARWAAVPQADARATWSRLAASLHAVRLSGVLAWILDEDADLLTSAPEPTGVRFLPAEEMRLFEMPHIGRVVPPYADTFHPHALVVDGEVVGSWGRRGGRFSVRCAGSVAVPSLESAVAQIPIPGRRTSLRLEGPVA